MVLYISYSFPSTVHIIINIIHIIMQGMVDPGDTVSRTLRKEFGEEAMNTLEATPEEKQQMERQINELFKEGHKVRKREREREGEGERESCWGGGGRGCAISMLLLVTVSVLL